MTTTESKTTTLESLEVAQREFEAGNYIESSRILWQATQSNLSDDGKGARARPLKPQRDGQSVRQEIQHQIPLPRLSDFRQVASATTRKWMSWNTTNLDSPHEDLPPFIRKCYREFAPDDASQ